MSEMTWPRPLKDAHGPMRSDKLEGAAIGMGDWGIESRALAAEGWVPPDMMTGLTLFVLGSQPKGKSKQAMPGAGGGVAGGVAEADEVVDVLLARRGRQSEDGAGGRQGNGGPNRDPGRGTLPRRLLVGERGRARSVIAEAEVGVGIGIGVRIGVRIGVSIGISIGIGVRIGVSIGVRIGVRIRVRITVARCVKRGIVGEFHGRTRGQIDR